MKTFFKALNASLPSTETTSPAPEPAKLEVPDDDENNDDSSDPAVRNSRILFVEKELMASYVSNGRTMFQVQEYPYNESRRRITKCIFDEFG